MAVKLPNLPDIAKLSTSVIAVLGGNPNKFTLQGSNTYILGTGPSRILIDTAEGLPLWKDSIARVLKDENITISTCLLTHWHGDHIGGVSDLRALCPEATIWKAFGNSVDPAHALTDVSLKVITDGMRFDDAHGFEIEAIYCPGHTKDHMAFVVTQSPADESEVGTLFTADNVLGHGTAVFEDLATYLQSLAVMKSRLHAVTRDPFASATAQSDMPSTMPKVVRAYPGHGAVIENASAKIDEYIEHRQRREDEALNVLRYGTVDPSAGGGAARDGQSGTNSKEWDSMDMVKVIYWDVPEHLHAPARGGLLMVLAKLKGEGKVVETLDKKWKIAVADTDTTKGGEGKRKAAL